MYVSYAHISIWGLAILNEHFMFSCPSFKEIQRECTSEQAMTTSTVFAVTSCAQFNSI